jgi:hypothetical protein
MIRQAVITLEFEAQDWIEAKAREREIKALVDSVREDFQDVKLRVIERRPRRAKRAPAPVRLINEVASTSRWP